MQAQVCPTYETTTWLPDGHGPVDRSARKGWVVDAIGKLNARTM